MVPARLQVQDGHQGEADLLATADSATWLGFLAKERSPLWALLRRKIRIRGSPKLLAADILLGNEPAKTP